MQSSSGRSPSVVRSPVTGTTLASATGVPGTVLLESGGIRAVSRGGSSVGVRSACARTVVECSRTRGGGGGRRVRRRRNVAIARGCVGQAEEHGRIRRMAISTDLDFTTSRGESGRRTPMPFDVLGFAEIAYGTPTRTEGSRPTRASWSFGSSRTTSDSGRATAKGRSVTRMRRSTRSKPFPGARSESNRRRAHGLRSSRSST